MNSTGGGVVGGGGRRLLAVALGLVLAGDLLGLAHVSGGGRGTHGVPASAATDVAAGLVPPPSSAAAGAQSSATAKASGGTARTTTTTVPVPTTINEGWDFPVTLTPHCARVGQKFTIVLGIGPDGAAAMGAVYADGDPHETWSVGQAGPDGKYTYTWVAPPAPGDAVMAITASDAGQKHTGKKTISFRVVGVTGRC